MQIRFVGIQFFSTFCSELFDAYCSYNEAKEIGDSLNTTEDVGKQKFMIGNFYWWGMIGDKDVKTQVNEYYKLLQELKYENTTLQ